MGSLWLAYTLEVEWESQTGKQFQYNVMVHMYTNSMEREQDWDLALPGVGVWHAEKTF